MKKLIDSSMEWKYIFDDSFPNFIEVRNIVFYGKYAVVCLFGSTEKMKIPARWIERKYDVFEFEVLIHKIYEVRMENFNASGACEIVLVDHELSFWGKDGGRATFSAEQFFLSNIRGGESGDYVL